MAAVPTFIKANNYVKDPGTGEWIPQEESGSADALAGQTLDYDTGGGTEETVVIGIALPGSGGPVAGGTAANPLAVDIVSGSSSGTEYTEGDTDASISGSAILWEDAGDTLRPVSAASPLPVEIVGGSSSGTEYTEGDVDATPSGSVLMWKDAGDEIVSVSATTPLPISGSISVDTTGLATEAKQDTGNTSLASIDSKITAVNTEAVTIAALPNEGQQTMANSISVAIASNQSAVPVDGSGVTQPVSNAGLTELAAAINSSKLDINIASSDVALSGGTQYTEGDTDASITGTALLWEDAADTLTTVSASKPLPVGDSGGSLTVDANNLDIRDLSAAADSVTVHGDVGAVDQLDLTNSNPLVVAIVDGSGDQITSFGGGTQYTEDAAAAANPVGTAVILVRDDSPGALVSDDGDNVAQRGTNYGAAYVQVVNSSGSFVDTFGGGTQYTEGDTDASITGTAILWEDSSDTLTPVSASKPLPVDITNASVAVTNAGLTELAAAINGSSQMDVNIAASNATVTVSNAGLTELAAAINGSSQMDVNIAAQSLGTLTVASHAVTNAGTFAVQVDGNALTALQLIDDPVATLGTTTYTETTTKGMIVGAVRRDADTTLVDTTNEVGPLQMDANGRLKVEAFSGETLPVSLTSTTITGTVSVQSNSANLATQTTAAAIQTSVELIDDAIFVDDTATHSTGNTKVMGIGAVATPTDASVNANDIGMPAMTTDRKLHVAVMDALPAGTAAIGKLAANNGVDIGDVDVTSVVPGTGATNLGKAEDGGHTTADVGVMMLGVVDNSPDAARADADNDYVPISLTNTGAVRIAPISEDFAVLANGPQVKKYYTSAGAVTDGIIWSPASGKRWYVTDIICNVSAAATVTFEDDKVGGDETVAKFELAANSGFCHSFSTPWFSGEDAADLMVTTSAGNIYITVTGYEI